MHIRLSAIVIILFAVLFLLSCKSESTCYKFNHPEYEYDKPNNPYSNIRHKIKSKQDYSGNVRMEKVNSEFLSTHGKNESGYGSVIRIAPSRTYEYNSKELFMDSLKYKINTDSLRQGFKPY